MHRHTLLTICGSLTFVAAIYVLVPLYMQHPQIEISKPPHHHRVYIAHLADGQMLLDEKGHALLFDSRKAADDYLAEYEGPPPQAP